MPADIPPAAMAASSSPVIYNNPDRVCMVTVAASVVTVERRRTRFRSRRVVIRSLAHAVRVGLPLRGLDSPVGYLGNECIEVVDEDSVHSVTGMLGPLLDVHRPMLGKFPHGLRVACDERWWRAEGLLIGLWPSGRAREVLSTRLAAAGSRVHSQ
jgi:hypothetical protein